MDGKTGKSGFDYSQYKRYLLLSALSTSVLGLTQSPLHRVPKTLSMRLKWMGPEAGSLVHLEIKSVSKWRKA
jgi:hypothetical protein